MILLCLLPAQHVSFSSVLSHCTWAVCVFHMKLPCEEKHMTVCSGQFWYCLGQDSDQYWWSKFHEGFANISLKGSQLFSIQTCFLIHSIIPYQAGTLYFQSCQTQEQGTGNTKLSLSYSNLQCFKLLPSRTVCLVSHSLFAQNTFQFSIQQSSFMGSVMFSVYKSVYVYFTLVMEVAQDKWKPWYMVADRCLDSMINASAQVSTMHTFCMAGSFELGAQLVCYSQVFSSSCFLIGKLYI